MATTKEFNKAELQEMAAHLTRKNTSEFSRQELLDLVRDKVMNLKVKVHAPSFPATEVYNSIKASIERAGLELVKIASGKVIFGIPRGKSAIRLVSVTDVTKKNRRKITVYFGDGDLTSEIVELERVDDGTRTCGSANQVQYTIDGEVLESYDATAVAEEITRLAAATKDNRAKKEIVRAQEKAARKTAAKFDTSNS